MSSTRSVHFPASPVEEQAARMDRLALFLETCEHARHCQELLREVQRGRADLETTIPILDRAAQRLARAAHALAEGG